MECFGLDVTQRNRGLGIQYPLRVKAADRADEAESILYVGKGTRLRQNIRIEDPTRRHELIVEDNDSHPNSEKQIVLGSEVLEDAVSIFTKSSDDVPPWFGIRLVCSRVVEPEVQEVGSW